MTEEFKTYADLLKYMLHLLSLRVSVCTWLLLSIIYGCVNHYPKTQGQEDLYGI